MQTWLDCQNSRCGPEESLKCDPICMPVYEMCITECLETAGLNPACTDLYNFSTQMDEYITCVTAEIPPQSECNVSADCDQGMECDNGKCIQLEEPDCYVGSDCGAGYFECVNDNCVQIDVMCSSNADCPYGACYDDFCIYTDESMPQTNLYTFIALPLAALGVSSAAAWKCL